jgi:hypothetical protein
LAEIEGTLFLDLYPENRQAGAAPFFEIHFAPLHTIYRVDQTTPKVKLAAIDYGWLDKLLTEHPDAIQHAVFNGSKLITAPTKDVQAFVVKHKDAFNANLVLERAPAEVN